MAPIDSIITSATANAVGTTISTLLTLRIIAYTRSDQPRGHKTILC
jgi:hypothetical protein